jgi:two-component system, OmpR family, alkaline phosphatase synthesis response regulator PhoP
MYRILLVEDEEALRDTLQLNLELEGYETITLASGSPVVATLEHQHIDLILLDIMLPDLNGLDVCEQIRLRNFTMPIIFLTAKDTPADRIAGLRRGADDYLAKPFHLEELLLRMAILLRRNTTEKQQPNDILNFGGHTVNFRTYEVQTANNQQFMLTKKEAMLLKLLSERAGQVVSRQQILQTVWGYDVYPSTRTIDNFILSFRKYFEENPKKPLFFHAMRGVGYKMELTAKAQTEDDENIVLD